MTLLLLILLLFAYIYGAMTDYKRREIEDKVSIAIITISIIAIIILPSDSVLYIPFTERIAMLVVFFIASVIPAGVGGGDMKILMATGFCFGFAGSAFILILTAVGAAIIGIKKKVKAIPLASVMLLPTILLLSLSVIYEIN